ncbi:MULTISPECIES: hypothetical protein [Rhodopirellula]|uniref:hypothetical protein n=1 Tax=Rhodopirellula TaxID=265488 RepID=UPI00257E5F8E|nr:hypothetical protein [Rhodopirellula sp. UBA1907]
MQVKDGKLSGFWKHYSREGTIRKVRPIEPKLTLQTGEEYLLSPLPGEPTQSTVNKLAGWSPESRANWEKGEPAPTTGETLRAIAQLIDQLIAFPPNASVQHGLVLSAWVMMTYIYPALPALPYLYFSGPPGSGKTRTMDVLARLAFRPMMTGNLTAAALFRSRHANGGTLLFDEAERLNERKSESVSELRSILLSGYRRGASADRMEYVKDKWETRSFDFYGPIAIGCISGLPPALYSRCINVRMMRAAEGSVQASLALDDLAIQFAETRDMLHRWALEHGHDAATLTLGNSSLSNRNAELWDPLRKIVAHTGDTQALELLTNHAIESSSIAAESVQPSYDRAILAALYSIRASGEAPTASQILALAEQLDPDLASCGFKPRMVGSVLRNYFDPPKKSNGDSVWRTPPNEIKELAKRYGYNLPGDNQ